MAHVYFLLEPRVSHEIYIVTHHCTYIVVFTSLAHLSQGELQLCFRRQLRFRSPGHFCICPVGKIHNFSTFEFSTRFRHRRARKISLKIYKKFNYFRVFVKLFVTSLLNVVSRRYGIYERSPQSLHINILTYEHTFMFE